MRNRPASWPLVSVGLMGAGVGAVGFLFYFLSGDAGTKPLPVASSFMVVAGAATALAGWVYDPRD